MENLIFVQWSIQKQDQLSSKFNDTQTDIYSKFNELTL